MTGHVWIAAVGTDPADIDRWAHVGDAVDVGVDHDDPAPVGPVRFTSSESMTFTTECTDMNLDMIAALCGSPPVQPTYRAELDYLARRVVGPSGGDVGNPANYSGGAAGGNVAHTAHGPGQGSTQTLSTGSSSLTRRSGAAATRSRSRSPVHDRPRLVPGHSCLSPAALRGSIGCGPSRIRRRISLRTTTGTTTGGCGMSSETTTRSHRPVDGSLPAT